ncbi:type II toxin-antitoxin system YoeB family toxin [Pelobium manganitolerans]|uniref:type II toxin-antitoxin system YoeB family toxin n=1 Tax=Pelobium manganitolerans TaxID=1842495 RepID=UPI001C7CBC18|nr:type II toxin-antitoxin system YoeB family toxin [Pelobium manganitolerans]
MEIVFLPKAKEDLDFWVKSKNTNILQKIYQLTEAIVNTPYRGIGKPEALKHQLSGK